MQNGPKTIVRGRQPRPAASFAGRSRRWTSGAARPEPIGSQNARRNYERYLALARAEAQIGNTVLKPGGRLILVDSLQRGDQPDYDGLLELFPQNYHEPYYRSYTKEDFSALAAACGLAHIRDVKAFVSKVMVFDKPAVA